MTIDAIDNDALIFTGSVGLGKSFAQGANLFGRLGVKHADLDNELSAYGLKAKSTPSFTTVTGEVGASKTFNNVFTGEIMGEIMGFGEAGDDIESYGVRGRLAVKF